MTLILGQLCTDGVLMLADSICISDDAPPTSLGEKALFENFDGYSCCLVFAGFAGIEGRPSTLSRFQAAAVMGAEGLAMRIAEAARNSIVDAVVNGQWKPQEAARKLDLELNQRTHVFVSTQPDNFWLTTSLYAGHFPPHPIEPGHIVCHWPTTDNPLKTTLEALCNHGSRSISEAAPHLGALFDVATRLLPDGCMYPGTACLHTATKKLLLKFDSREQLVALVNVALA